MARSWAAVLPVQPMLVLPLDTSNGGPPGISLTFRRKPTGEKPSTEGGLRFVVGAGESGEPVLMVTRQSEGQSVAKIFSERKLVRALCQDLERLPAEAGSVASVVHADLLQG